MDGFPNALGLPIPQDPKTQRQQIKVQTDPMSRLQANELDLLIARWCGFDLVTDSRSGFNATLGT
jgi:hypothetical protein